MKRARDPDDIPEDVPALKKPAVASTHWRVPITSSDIAAVRAEYDTSFELVAAEGRTFPVNRRIVGRWSEPLRTLMYGTWRENHTAQASLPFSNDAVAILVQHCYACCNLADPPLVKPEDALEVMRLAHLYALDSLLAAACDELLSHPFPFVDDLYANLNLLRSILVLDTNPRRICRWFYNSWAMSPLVRTLPSFSIDPGDDVFRPFLREALREIVLPPEIILAVTEYTPEIATEVEWLAVTPEEYNIQFMDWMPGGPRADQFASTAEELARMGRFRDSMIVGRAKNACGVISRHDAMRHVEATYRGTNRGDLLRYCGINVGRYGRGLRDIEGGIVDLSYP